jgi:uncharacterized protein
VQEEELKEIVADYLDRHTVFNLATAGREGAHAAPVFYARVNYDLYWFSEPRTQHSIDIHRGLGCAGAITDNAKDYRDIQGLQLTGVAEALKEAAETEVGLSALRAKFDFLEDFVSDQGTGLMDKVSIYRFQPLTITWIDNSVSFGFKQTLHFET